MDSKDVFRLIFSGLLIFLGACSTNQVLDQSVIYPRDMRIVFEKQKYDGVAVFPKREVYSFEVHAKGNLDLFTVTSCHREVIKEEAGKSGWFGEKKKVDVKYRPRKEIEVSAACPIQLGGYEVSKGRHSWAFIDFEDDENKLPGRVVCSGAERVFNGVSACQAREGLIQEISFEVPAKVFSNCDGFPALPGKLFQFKMQRGQCIYGFKELNGGRTHRLTTLGYESILLRE